MRVKTKKTISIILVILITLVSVIAGFNIYFSVIGNDKQYGNAVGYEWDAANAFEKQKSSSIEMGEDDFKILVLTDIHLKNHGTFGAWLGINYLLDWVGASALDKLVEKVDPNLIVILGDSVLTKRNDIETARLVKQMDAYKIPWAPVFGNHDDEGRADKARLAEIYQESEYGLFEFGPKDLHGAGNYIVELSRADKTEYVLHFFDSGSSFEFDAKSDGINENQTKFYKWNMDAFLEKQEEYPKNMAFFHIPLPIYSELENFELGERAEPSFPGQTDAGLLDIMSILNGTHIFVGHDHNNNFVKNYNGIKLGYAMKSSYNCYYKNGMTGGTLLTINSQNNVKEELVYF